MAIEAAKTDSVVDSCTAGNGADTIILPAGTYSITIAGADEDANATGDFDITDDLAISGSVFATAIIDGGGLDRVFHVLNAVVDFSSVTIQNGSSNGGGGGIMNTSRTITLTNAL